MPTYCSLVNDDGTQSTAIFDADAFAGWRGTIERAAAGNDFTLLVTDSPEGLRPSKTIHSLREAADWVAEVAEWQS